ncbi:hypothetical protein [Silvanigrella aquatica]|uniref:Uncharacterized protein n=1 Tax=Silvanigrella aquatica TaxID=1915309 RepID=A0A1L4D3Z9_9BACT|nr:hypothetical protein [Silvanigrella aquatica]APJ04909.1 hypothetical protein AXG55_13805 [Silvanigrella aquatica]
MLNDFKILNFEGNAMKLKNTLMLISTYSVMAFSAQSAYAIVSLNDTNISEDEKKVKENKAILSVDQSFSQNETEYTVYDNLSINFKNKKVDKKSLSNNKSEQNLNYIDINTNDKKVFIDKGSYEIYLDKNISKRSINNSSSKNSSSLKAKKEYKVAFNNKTKKFGILTGNAVLKINPESTVQIPDNTFSIVRAYKNMGLYIIKVPSDLKINESLAKLKEANPMVENLTSDANDPNASSLKVEVIENFKSAM